MSVWIARRQSVPPRWIKRRYRATAVMKSPRLAAGDEFKSPLDNPHADAAAVAKEGRFAVFSVTTLSCRFPRKSRQVLLPYSLPDEWFFRHHPRLT